MLTSLDAPYAHETLPKGSGTITGIVAKVKLTNFLTSPKAGCVFFRFIERTSISVI